MLIKVLDCLNKKGNFSARIISKELNIPELIVEDLKDKLIKMECIRKVNCDQSLCEKCTCGCSSTKLNDKVDWEITDKGYKILNKNRG
ncbi:hypothetical protein CHF27_006530 [Romboutsia maritimum]|uniref:Transcriptional regulator HTH-type FeoC domain-containing protein n=1 Tax=Romboutsia maritimum TaxID=2020948 RepID=A0A371ITG8_9FIRM|nr:hypothetical protein [Romboutsia maritimum]RDY23773.1 hypothetical protein CHF27_006530 [Romboutsia maritimum]